MPYVVERSTKECSTRETINDNRPVVVIIVSFRTPRDVAACLASLETLPAWPNFNVYICENGGPAAWEELVAAISRPEGPCDPAEPPTLIATPRLARTAGFRLRRSRRSVVVGEAAENLGYAGGVNAWLMPLLEDPDWPACWILNPDATVLPGTLTALAQQAAARQLGMVGSRIMIAATDNAICTRGLRWRAVLASCASVGRGAPAAIVPDAAAIEAELDAASGASVLMVRACLERLLPLDERYFLYFEDLDWGIRARRVGFRIGHANESVVIHPGGTSLGSRSENSVGSPLSIYLEFRNRLLFVKTHNPRWWLWTVAMSCGHALRLVRRGGWWPAYQGILAALRGEVGRPDRLVAKHRSPV